MKGNLTYRVLSIDELDLFVDFVRDHYKPDHSYVLHPEMAMHFYAADDRLNIYAAFRDGKLIGIWPFLFYNQDKTDAAGCLFSFKPVDELPFVGQFFMKKFLDDLAPDGFFTAGIIERLLPFYKRVKHDCGRFKQYYWTADMAKPAKTLRSHDRDAFSIRLLQPSGLDAKLAQKFPQSDFLPRKDYWFLEKSYLNNNSQSFQVFVGSRRQEEFVFVTATYETPVGRILRFYDYFGKRDAFPLVLEFLQQKVVADECAHVDIIVAGIEEPVFTDAGFEFLDTEDAGTIVPNNFFPFQNANSQVHYGIRLNKESQKGMPVLLFKGTGDQLIPGNIRHWGRHEGVNVC